MTSIVSAPGDLIIATSDDIDVRFAGVILGAELSPFGQNLTTGKGVQVKLEGVRGSQTRQHDLQFEAAQLAWTESVKAEGREKAGQAPQMPAVAVLNRVGVVLTDDIGTDYRLAGGHVAGSGTEWDASWFYSPEPPETAQTLRLEFSLDDAPTGKVCVVKVR